MTDLVESSTWTPGIRQFETSDPVEGGPDGIDNVPLRQLANRTRFLKDAHEALAGAQNPYPQYATIVQMQAAISALVDAAPGALDTLSELSKALGNDPNFATTMTNALALKAALDSPIFTGTPKAPTPPQFDSSTKLATTAFVQTALGNLQSFTMNPGTNATLTQAQAGGGWDIYGACTITLPSTVGLPLGACYSFSVGAAVTFNCVGSDQIYFNDSTPTTTSFVPVTGTAFRLVKINANQWLVFSEGRGSVSMSANGYQKLPSGLIIQWGVAAGSGNSTGAVVTLPLAMPNAILQVVASDSGSSLFCGGVTWSGKTQFNLIVGVSGGSSYTTGTLRWVAIGY
ncbi:hypothetical protein WK58_09850 [Burkholderia ubonensis]|uniref:gp53-like domain-containing protein n=1 Tax=Burkholderia ubonensis TaxID=101571 RepID=UPI00075284F1|nr:hypothetical protein [Burkholderia ubonensis]KVT77946.1 hypothetical protein WK58_09850 [Burkholderia ubonensis]